MEAQAKRVENQLRDELTACMSEAAAAEGSDPRGPTADHGGPLDHNKLANNTIAGQNKAQRQQSSI